MGVRGGEEGTRVGHPKFDVEGILAPPGGGRGGGGGLEVAFSPSDVGRGPFRSPYRVRNLT